MSLDLSRDSKLLEGEKCGGIIHILFNLIVGEDHMCD